MGALLSNNFQEENENNVRIIKYLTMGLKIKIYKTYWGQHYCTCKEVYQNFQGLTTALGIINRITAHISRIFLDLRGHHSRKFFVNLSSSSLATYPAVSIRKILFFIPDLRHQYLYISPRLSIYLVMRRSA